MFKITDFEDVSAGEFELVNPRTGKPTGAFITLAGPEHPGRKRAVMQRSRELRQKMEATGRLELDGADDDAAETALLAEFTLGWRGLAGADGAELPFSTVAAEVLYRDPARHWLRVQVQNALAKRELFIKSSGGA